MFKRKPSFIIITIEDMGLIKKYDDHMISVIKKLHKEQSIHQIIINYCYYFFSYILSKIYYKSYKVFNTVFINKKESCIIKNLIMFYIFDSSILFYGKMDNGVFSVKVPYEYILEFRNLENKFEFIIFGTIDKDFIYTFSNKKTIIRFETKELLNFTNLVKLNMYYHILFNKLDVKAIEYFTSKQD